MAIYTAKNYSNYLTHAVRVYCCGIPLSLAVIMSEPSNNNHYGLYVFGDTIDQSVVSREKEIMEQSTMGLFCFTDPKMTARTLLMMGYSVLSFNLRGMVYSSGEIEHTIVQNVASMYQYPVYTSIDDVIKSLYQERNNTYETKVSV